MTLPPPDPIRQQRSKTERRLLAALCQQTLDAPLRDAVVHFLAARNFAHAEHQAIFRALSPLLAAHPENLRELLGTRITLLGFPDIDLDEIFTLAPPSLAEISALLLQV